MNELIESIVANSYAIAGAIFSACLAGYIGLLVNRKSRLAAAAATFRAAIDPEAFTRWRGHDLHKALVRDFPAHKKAVVEFRHYLRGKDRLRLEQAWAKYHGGSEENPDFFVMYCIPANGPELLKQRLEALRDAGKHT